MLPLQEPEVLVAFLGSLASPVEADRHSHSLRRLVVEGLVALAVASLHRTHRRSSSKFLPRTSNHMSALTYIFLGLSLVRLEAWAVWAV